MWTKIIVFPVLFHVTFFLFTPKTSKKINIGVGQLEKIPVI